MRESAGEERFRGEEGARRMREVGANPQDLSEQGLETNLISSMERLQKIVISLLIRNEQLREWIRIQDAWLGEMEGAESARAARKVRMSRRDDGED